ncbi:RNA polymerase sigma-54 factor 2 [Variibacter gotjawalensis]|uniref:RNA polymerase sigma-54 factor n=2 Tax=Variibacter gotjawalensis TaxID=1333996 RepID=A0A0S3PUZ5_9BRAD|nr:RNA polymerase sigma-54 factor [Variibacter gotjawalensis]BAT59777.1 RNA polymerase sigma-54 factor 2 [Variibacter gotjawalensis]
MTPQLMQAIKLLQLSSLDLSAYVEAELEKNPLLERADAEPSNDVPENEAPASDREFADGEPDSSDWMGESLDVSRDSIEQRLDTSLENVFPSELPDQPARASTNELPAVSEWANVGSGGRDGDDFGLESFAAAEISLRDHLSEQMALALTSPVDRLIGAHLIDMVDEAGYISGELAPIAEKLGAEAAHVERVLSVLQTLDPAGVCARNLAECLELQLRDRNRFDPAMAVLIANLELIAKRDYAQLRKLCGVDDEDIAEMVGEIRQLNPKPGHAFGSTLVQPVIPDVLVRPAQDGSWQVELNNDTLPKVLLNQSYFAQVSKGVLKPGEKAYLSECMQNGTWLVRALDQRARTILKVATEIVRQQDGFFALGVQHLRPLSLRVIADAIGMHESTVSRVTANKYMATTRGIFELKYFFTSSIASADGGDAHSAEAVRFRIKNLIDGEGVSDILSDDTIVTRLRDAGIDIARRTVAKYREAMRIPSSVQRRRDKQALGQAFGRTA